jgi:predicted small metal-binding protein
MAYARFGSHGDVYVHEDVRGFLCCMRCNFSDARETRTKSRGEMIEHLEAHRRAGHKVPDDAIEELRAEITKSGDLVTK